ncbi:MAG TPA: hypothetical protein PLC15_23200 [Candidatus Obscuribacter sp.]|nr:hypothetical protein [Candidatus Obscuribacter sp.]HNB18315.1 hypothetical protein [Candidatus Obscuribacter sp.]
MSDTARDYQSIQPATTEGLDSFFEQGLLQQDPEDSSPQPGGLLQQGQGVPVHVAAARLGLSTSGVLKRLRKGSLPGFKVPVARGEKWFVKVEALPGGVLELMEDSSGGLLGLVKDSSEQPLEMAKDSLISDGKPPLLVDDLMRRNSELEAQLQAATWRNGYLEAQLEAERQQVKLLTDSQHKPGWWPRFKKWCAWQ